MSAHGYIAGRVIREGAEHGGKYYVRRRENEKRAFWTGFEKSAASMWPKRVYKETDIESLDPNQKDEIWTAKIDGAHTVVKMEKGKLPRLFSHRTSKRTGGAIEYTEKIPHLGRPSPVTGTFRAETYAVDRSGKAVHPDIVTAMLNRTKENSLQLQKEMGLRTRVALIDVDDPKLESAMYPIKRKLMSQIAKQNPDFVLPAMAATPKAKKSLLGRILAGKHPQTKEGVIVHKDHHFIKAKTSKEHDVYVREVFPEESQRGLAGGFTYSWEPEGPIKGRVGTGFDHDLKKDMLKNPDEYVGRVARVRALDVSKNQVLMKPSFSMWHVEKNIDKAAAQWAKQSIIVQKSILDDPTDRMEAKNIAKGFADRLYTSRATSQSFRFRQKPPSLFEPGSFRTRKTKKEGVSIVWGKIRE